jgi:hypothetical protein
VEIKDYLKVLGKRAWLLVMIPAVAGVVAGLIAVNQPQAFRTTATLQLPRDATTTPALIAQKVADFKAAANNPTVQNTVSQDTGVPVKKIENLKIAQVGDSSQLTMSYLDKTRTTTNAKAVVMGVAKGALDYLQAPQVQAGQRAVQAANDKIAQAQDDITKAQGDLSALYYSIETSTPDDDIKVLRTQLVDLQGKLLGYQVDGNTTGQAAVQKLIDADQTRLQQLLEASGQAVPIQARLTDAQAALKTATDERDTATKQLDTATATLDLTFSTEGQAVVRKTRVVKTAAAAVVAGFPIAIGLVLLLDASQRRRRQRALEAGQRETEPLEDEEHEEVAPQPAVLVPSRAARPPDNLNGDHELRVTAAAVEPAVMLASRTSLRTDDYAGDLEEEDDEIFADAGPGDLQVATDVEEEEEAEQEDFEDEFDDFDDLDELDEDEAEEEEAEPLVAGPVDADADADDLDELEEAEAVEELDELEEIDDEEAEEVVAAADAEEVEAGADDASEEVEAGADDASDEVEAADDASDEVEAEAGDADVDDVSESTSAEDVPVSTNGRRGRQPARVPDGDEAFEEDDEGPEADR